VVRRQEGKTKAMRSGIRAHKRGQRNDALRAREERNTAGIKAVREESKNWSGEKKEERNRKQERKKERKK
jgi:hypothetical protein